MKKPVVIVQWEDCHIVATNWEHPEEVIIPDDTALIISFGLLWKSDKSGIVIVGDFDPFEGCIGRATWIPRGQIKKITKLGTVDCDE